ncbi:tetratricopeptide repeat protein [Flavobacterium sp.]|uniref:tetratricopeptide repeat protein n=1 Tax=Flavobacterium sp. TaxID=239 RepID=UPI0040336014
MNIGNYPFAVDLYVEVLQGFKDIGRMRNYYLTLINYGECLINLKKYKEARKAFLDAIAGLQPTNDTELIANAYASLAKLESGISNDAQAIAYYKKAFEMAYSINSPRLLPIVAWYISELEGPEKRGEALAVIAMMDKHPAMKSANLIDLTRYEKNKAAIYKMTGKSALAIKSMEAAIKLMDTLEKADDKAAVIEMQGGFQKKYQDKKGNSLKKVNAALQKNADVAVRSNRMYVILPCSVLLLLALSYFYRNARHRIHRTDRGYG